MKFSALLKWLLTSLTFYVGPDDDGGGADDDGEAIGTRNDDRLAMFSEIADSAEEKRSDEFDTSDIDAGGTDTRRQAADDVEDLNAAAAPRLPKIKVNGVEMDLTPEMIERAQKVTAADQYLAEAARIRRDAEQQNTGRPSAQDAGSQVEEDDLALARALQMGSEEDAAAAIRAIRQKSPSLSRDEVVTAAKDAIAMDDAVAWFQSEYDFIWKDPKLTALAMQRDQELLQSENLSYRDRYAKIGNELREWTGTLPRAQDSKQTRKEAASENVVPIASRRAEPAVQEETEESTQDVIASMARRRGQSI